MGEWAWFWPGFSTGDGDGEYGRYQILPSTNETGKELDSVFETG
jgi:hypothetical protein